MSTYMFGLWMLWTTLTSGAITVTSSGTSEIREGGLLVGLVDTTVTERSKVVAKLNAQGQPNGNESRFTMEQTTTITLSFLRPDGKTERTTKVKWLVSETITKLNGIAVVGNAPTFIYTEQIEWTDIVDLVSAPLDFVHVVSVDFGRSR